MNKIFAALVVATFLPAQTYAAVEFNFDPIEQGLLRVNTPFVLQEPKDVGMPDKIMAPPPRPFVEEKKGTNWWIWGAVGLAVLVGGGVALAAGGGSKGGGAAATGGGTSTSTVTGSW